MNKIKYILLALTVFIYTGCEEEVPTPEGTNYIAFADSEFSTGVDVGSSNSFDIPVYSANITGSDRSFDILVDPASAAAAGSYTVPQVLNVSYLHFARIGVLIRLYSEPFAPLPLTHVRLF